MASYNNSCTDSVTVNETLPNSVVLKDTLAETAALPTQLDGWAAYPVSVQDDSTYNEALPNTVIFTVAETEALTVHDAPVPLKRVDIVLADGTSIADDALGPAQFSLLIDEGFVFSIVLNIDGQEYVCWVANADTFAHSQYESFDFDSMCRIGQNYFGAKRDGIYRLDGSTDDGDEINWFLSLGRQDFGTSLFKRMPRVYMGIKNDGFLYIRTITDGGIKRTYMFRRRVSDVGGAGETLGRGVKSRYWGFDLVGIDGADVEIDSIEFFPVVLGRRVP